MIFAGGIGMLVFRGWIGEHGLSGRAVLNLKTRAHGLRGHAPFLRAQLRQRGGVLFLAVVDDPLTDFIGGAAG